MAKKYVAEDSASMFVLEDVDDQFGLKTPSRRKPKHRRRVLPSLKATSTTNVEKKAKLRSTLRPHFVSSGDEQPHTLIVDKNLDEQDSEIAKIGLVTAEDAVDYFAADQEGKVVFVHLIPTVSSTDFRPYSLDVVPASVAVARGDYYTMSRSGLVHCVLEKGSNSTEFTPLHEWIRHCTFFNVLRSMNFFRYFLHFKLFREWRRNVRRKLYRDQRLKLQSKLFLSREVFRTPCMLLKAEISSISKFPLVSVQRSGRPQSDPLDVFLEQQNATRKGAAVACEAMMKSVVEILATACDAVQKLDREATLLDQDPRKRLEVLMNAKLLDDDGATSPSTRHKSMNSAVEEKKARKRLAIRAAEDRSMLSDFVRLADTMMVELVVDHVLQSFEHDLLADFLTNSSSDHHHQQHKTIGLFEVALGFDDTGLIFVPPLNEFCAKADGLADEVIALAGRIPRVLDARGCAEHCTSADSAAKFEPLIRSLPRYRLFVDSLRLKFAQDFDVARQHNLPTAETVRPIYEASRDFCQDEERARLLSNESSIDAAVRREFDQMMAWNKDLDKLRTRDSVGTIEVTSRQLKLTLSAFIEKKLDLLKSIIRERARDQCGEVLKTLKRRVSQLEDVPSTLQEYAEYVQRTADYDERDMRKLRNHVDQMYAILQSNDVKIRPEDLVALEEMHSYASQYSEQLAKSRALKENALDGHSEQLDKDIVALNSSLGQLTADLSSGPFLLPELYFSEDDDSISASLDNLQKQLAEYSDTVSTYSSYKELFGGGYGVVDTAPLKLATDQYNVMEKLWKCVRDWRRAHKEWTEGDLTRLDADDVDRQMQEFSAKAFSLNKTLDSPVSARLVSVVDEFKPLMPLVGDLGNPAMLQRHWEKLCTALGKSFADVELPISLSDFIEWGVNDQVDLVSEVSATATGESQLQKSLEKMEEAWKSMKFATKEWRTDGSYILVGVDEIQQELDDQIVKTQAMRGSRFVHPFLKQATDWESMLHTLQEIIDNWLLVQSAWLYLEPIFSSDDISRQIPAEARMFKVVNQVWRESMAVTVQDPAVVSVARRDGLVEKLKDSNQKLDRINKGLSEYLETKRLAFPRFFFLSNEELLSILAETKNPLLVQPHLKKSFDGICNLEFTERNDIIAAYDGAVGKSERLEFTYEACQHKKINPRDSNGNVECWLVEVEAIMKKSLAHAIDLALLEFATTERNDWLRKWQGQTLLTVNQITWVHQVENAIVQGQLTELHARRSDELLDIVKVVRGDISKSLRKTLGSLVVMDVHNRDVTQQLSQSTIKSPNEFGWQAHLRYYVRPDLKKKRSALTGEPGSIDCRMINASILYAYEYIGNCGRLVITPLTDRCYRTLMGAIHLNLGGAPEGPAGTGKTETTKDLGKAIAIQCVVTNCSDGLDHKAMGKFFKGLAASGAWACFDEFNRIQLEVLSVIAQQVHTIQQAKSRRAERFMFEGTDLPLKMTCCPFITMNPGYAGRAELPDNLKVLFRTVAMMVPDYAMIGEILLYSMGYTEAKGLAVKIVTTYKLCSEQLSSQSHYDYGMRAVMAVLRAAGNLKRQEGHLDEAVLVLRSIIDVNLPKFLSPDVPLFRGITSDLFPGVVIEPPDRTAFESAFRDVCMERNLQPTQYFWEKVVHIYDMMVVRHGFMIVGMPFSGKTSAWKALADTLTLLHVRYPEDTRWTGVVALVMNPKSVTMGQLYGQFDAMTGEWSDGCLAINYRNAAQGKVGADGDRKWILLDGPVDAIWIENMNTVLDDNKKLCLMSGEIIAMSDTMSMIFEPQDLLVASPATVSRCGMVYLQPEQLGWQPILDSWLTKWRKPVRVPTDARAGPKLFELEASDEARLRTLFGWLVEPLACLVRRELKEVSQTVDTSLVVSLLNQLEISYGKLLSEVDTAVARSKHLESAFLFALVWSFGASVDGNGRRRFSLFLRSFMKDVAILDTREYAGVKTLLAVNDYLSLACHESSQVRNWTVPSASDPELSVSNPFPDDGDCHDWFYDSKRGEWISVLGTLSAFDFPKDAEFSQIVVPTAFTAFMSYFCCNMLPAGVRPLIVGATGTGKSVCIAKALTKELDQDTFQSIFLGFSAKTSANMTQEIIGGQLTKRRKSVYGPPVGKKTVVFVDDMNMPEIEEFGAQPPIELLRQLVDSEGYYDLKDKRWVSVIDVVVTCAMGPPGGGRNEITPRFLRHFSTLCFNEFDDATLSRIFNAIVDQSFSSRGEDFNRLSHAVVDSTLQIYREATRSLLPTPSKSHYLFNLRDFSRVIQGVLMGSVVDALGIARLWLHEALRVFADRLTDDEDREWFVSLARDTIVKNFKLDFDDALLGHLKDGSTSSSNPKIGYGELRNLFFGNYMLPSEAEVRPYTEITDVNELEENIKQYLVDFNAMSKKPMDLVMFRFAIEHVSRISRILLMPGGNALLVGVGGSGRQSLTILATEIAGFTLKRIEISKSYGLVEWRDDVKVILREAGTGEKPVVFLFADTQIKLPGFAEDINNILNSGDVPNLYLNDEKVSICEAVRPFAQAKFGKAEASRMTTSQLFDYFTQRVRQRLHVVLAFSPIGDAFRERLRLFPSLVACCVINWFTAWPRDALVAVANQKLAQIKDLENRAAIVESCQYFHVSATELSARFKEATGRITYVTPTSYLELLLAFESSLAERRESVLSRKSRYKNGLEQLALAEANVGQMHKELTDLQPVLKQSQEDTDALMSEIEAKLPGVRAEEELVAAEAMTAQKEADAVKKQVDDVQADLDEAIPALNEALKALDTIKPNDINEIKVLGKPPATVKLVCEAVCVMLGEKPVKVPDPDDPSRKIHDYWPTAQKMLADKNFISKMKMYDKDNIPVKTISAIRDKYINDPSFTPEAALKASSAAAGLCKWCHAMSTYDRVAKLVAPKKEALAKAQESLAVTMGNLSAKKGSLQETQDSLAGLQAKLSSSKSKKDDLNAQVETCAAKLVRAKKLIEDLGGEKIRWAQFVEDLASDYSSLTGDVLVSAALMAYLGPFISSFRDVQMESWAAKIKALNIPSSPNPTDIAKTLGDPVKIRQAIVDGLPTDKTSTENAIVVWKAKRFPYMIDPDGQAKRWIKKSENDRGLKINKPNGDYLRDLESCVQYGVPFLLEDVGETLDAALEPLLLKQIFKVGGIDSIRLGDSTLPFDQSFSFYMTTRLRNPHLLPEIAVKVSLLAFLVTPEGLSDRLLGVVVAQERQDLEQRKSELVVEGAANAAKLKSIEDSILQILSSEGNILEDETAILTLGKSKVTSDTIKQRQEAADLTESEIDAARSQYKPCASATQVLFFCISDLVSVEPTYSYSLQWFTNLFVRSIQNSESSDDVTTRLENLSRHFEYSLYQNVCRSLLEKDKLLFSFLLTVRTLSAAADPSFDAGEWRFLLTGGVGSDNPHPNPCPDWLAVKSWDELCRLSELPNFKGLSATFQEHQEGYKRLNDSAIPHELPLPGEWDAKLKGLRRLCVLRCVRPDKVSLGVQNFVIEAKGKKFVQPPPFDLQACFDESVSTTPLIFVLSPGSDPMAAVLQLAENEKHEVRAISLGQGQGPVAEKLITQSRRDGSWVVLQNCHLAPSWMSNLEQICESLSSENVAKEFRLWCTTYPSPVFPVSVLQSGIKMTLEPPKGLRANLIGSYSASPIADDGFLDSCIQERREYGPIGWNIPYGFNASDLEISMQQLAMFLEESDSAHVPFEALKYCIGECNYGGRVTDAKDRITLNSILDRFFQADVVEVPGFSLSPSGKYAIPSAAASSLQHYVEIVEALPLVAEPEIFGFHENATITKDSNETDALFATLLLAEGSGGSSQAGQASADETVLTTACEILHKLPSEFDLEEAQIRYPVRWDESMNTVLCQELFKFNNLTKLIKSSLSSVIKAIKGTVVMSAELERVGESLVLGRIPDLWKSKSYPSFKDCASYISDILLRLDFFTTWLDREPPFTYWISAFFFPHAFFTASKQNMARKDGIPIDAIGFRYEMMSPEAGTSAPIVGTYGYGLFLEAARWDSVVCLLEESLPKVLFAPAPLVFFQPMLNERITHPPSYSCPVYKTLDRRGVLATTGHSTNFIMDILIPSNLPESHWIQRGVAMVSQLN